MLAAIIDSVFLMPPLPRTQVDFEKRLAIGKQRLMTIAHEYAVHLTEVLTEYSGLTQKLHKLSQHAAVQSSTLPDIKQHLHSLVHDGFVKTIPLERIKQLPRYLKAVHIRLERLEHDPHKDAKKAAQIAPLWKAYLQYHADHAKTNDALDEFHWMLEELRVSLFAQELKTAYPVSVQRLEKALQAL
jgi:ATP-dependent helicase HrpA